MQKCAICESTLSAKHVEGLVLPEGKLSGSPTRVAIGTGPAVLVPDPSSSATLGPLLSISKHPPRSLWLGTGAALVQGRHPLSGGQSS